MPWRYVQCKKCGLRTRGKWASDSSNICPIFLGEVRDEWNRRAALPIADQVSEQQLGRFGHHPNPAIDFCVEAESLLGEIENHRVGFTNGTPSADDMRKRIDAAMTFKVGGDSNAVLAKQQLREAIADLDRAIADGVSALPNGWIAVPDIGAMVTADHPQTCLNPDKVFEVVDVKYEHGGWCARGENTCWFGIGLLSAPPIATENASQEVG